MTAKTQVLVVDDEAAILRFLKPALEANSYEMTSAGTVAEAVKRIAAETGGKYFPLSKAADLVEELTYLEGKNSERISLDLWDMPFNLLLLLGLASAEWFLRKRKGLA